jgi:hypothetical protein
MPDPSLPLPEQAAAMRGQVLHFEQFGLQHESAVRAVAVINRLAPLVVTWLLETFPEPGIGEAI